MIRAQFYEMYRCDVFHTSINYVASLSINTCGSVNGTKFTTDGLPGSQFPLPQIHKCLDIYV
jgi:hypothetical protein